MPIQGVDLTSVKDHRAVSEDKIHISFYITVLKILPVLQASPAEETGLLRISGIDRILIG